MRKVRFFFDFISPYAWLALEQAGSFAAENAVRWELVPISYGALLSATGLVGPVETPAKREYTFDDVVRCAQMDGLEIVGPPTHPFRSLEALRAMTLFARDAQALELARRLAAAAWADGRDLTEVSVIESVLSDLGLDGDGIAGRISEQDCKQALIRNTEEALDAGVFGVPTFEFEGELFWGRDRMPHLAERLWGNLRPSRHRSSAMLTRPSGVERQR